MPWDEAMSKFKRGELHSGSKKGKQVKNPKKGKKVKNRKQAIAIMLSEKRKAAGKPEYRSKKKKRPTAAFQASALRG